MENLQATYTNGSSRFRWLSSQFRSTIRLQRQPQGLRSVLRGVLGKGRSQTGRIGESGFLNQF